MNDGDADAAEDWPALLSQQISLHGRLLFRTAFDILKDATAAEDIVQQALLKAWERRKDIAHPSMLKQWIVRAVVNGSLEVLRRKKIEIRVLKRRVVSGTEEFGPGADESETRAQLLDALADLPEPCRSILVLRVLEGMSGNDVKVLVGCSAAEVSRQLHRGLELLRDVMNASSAK